MAGTCSSCSGGIPPTSARLLQRCCAASSAAAPSAHSSPAPSYCRSVADASATPPAISASAPSTRARGARPDSAHVSAHVHSGVVAFTA